MQGGPKKAHRAFIRDSQEVGKLVAEGRPKADWLAILKILAIGVNRIDHYLREGKMMPQIP